MGIFIKKNKNFIIAAATAFLVSFLMIICSDIAVLSAKKGISLWISNVVPAMLPFFICVNFMTGIGIIHLLPAGIFPFVMSILSGYPMGAKVVGDMYRSGKIDKQEVCRLMSFCSTSGPVFMIGAVGVGMLGSQMAGAVIAGAHYLGAVINGLVYSFVFPKRETCHLIAERAIGEFDLLEELTAAIFAAFKSLAVILAYIIFFMFLMDILDSAGLFQMVSSERGMCLLKGFFEMTVGCNSLSTASLPLVEKTAMASMIISWGGLSIIGQSMSMLSGTKISFTYLIITNLMHSIFAGIIALFLGGLVL